MRVGDALCRRCGGSRDVHLVRITCHHWDLKAEAPTDLPHESNSTSVTAEGRYVKRRKCGFDSSKYVLTAQAPLDNPALTDIPQIWLTTRVSRSTVDLLFD